MSDKSHKLAAIVFTDIVGYTKQMEENEQLTMELLQRQREIIFPLVESYGGKVIKEIGDGLMMMFESAVQAVRFAISAQNRLKDEKLTIRAGIHIGDVIFEDGDVFGSAVNTAARIEPLAPSNGICISENVKYQLQNKSDIQTVSIGKKDLKGVSEPIEIFEIFIEGISDQKKRSLSWFIKDLWNRRVFQVVGAYLISAWIIKQAVAAMVHKHMMSPYLVDLAWVILLSLIPTVFLITYFHGKRKSSKWTPAELVGFPANIAFTLLIVIFMFKGKDLGAATEKLMLENEDGETIERMVVKSEFRKKMALYNFKNLSEDADLNWIQYSIPTMIEYDLSQDIYIECKSALKFFNKLKEEGFTDGMDLPITKMRKFAEYYHLNYFLDGDFNLKDGVYTIQTKLYNTQTSKLIAKNSFTGPNLFNLIDEISDKTKKDLKIPAAHIQTSDDLPISEIFTSSETALKYFAFANREILRNDFDKGIEYAEKAIEEDPGFAVAHLSLANFYFNDNQTEKSTGALDAAMDNIDDLPETSQFFLKFFYYLMRQEADKADAVVKMWVDLYPEDTEGRKTLAGRYINKGMIDEGIHHLKIILQLDPEEYDYLISVGDLYKKIGNYDSAMYYYQVYAKKFPGDFKSYRELGDLYLKIGDKKLAIENYNKALLIEPDEIDIKRRLGRVELLKGNLDKAKQSYNKTLSECNTASDSSDVYGALQSLYEYKGQFKMAVEYQEKKVECWKAFKTPKDILVQQTFTVSNYILAGKKDYVFTSLARIEKEFEPPLDKVAAFGYLFSYLELKDVENARKQIKPAIELIEGFGEQQLMANIYYAYARMHEIDGEYEEAIVDYKLFLEMQPESYSIHRWIARCYRNLEEYNDAEEHLELALEDNPLSPKSNYEAGLLFMATDDNEKALDCFQKANKIWMDADESYEPAQEVKSLISELSAV